MYIQKVSREAREVVNFGREKHWRFHPIQASGKLATPVIIDDWLFIPVDDDTSIIPGTALARVEAIKSAGFKTQGLILAHEAPKMLPMPKRQPKPKTEEAPKVNTSLIVEFITGALEVFGYVLLFSAMAIVDPALIVVLEDGTWLEVMTWYE